MAVAACATTHTNGIFFSPFVLPNERKALFLQADYIKDFIMNALTIQATQNDIIRNILCIENMDILNKVKRLLSREERKAAVTVAEEDDDEPCFTKEEILANFDQACKELKLNLEGKLEFKTLEEALNEL